MINIARVPVLVGNFRRSSRTYPILTQSWNITNSLSHNLVRFNHKKPFKRDEAKRLHFFVVLKYVQYVKNIGRVLEKKFPKALATYRQFVEGTKEFIKDTKEYLRVVRYLYNPEKNFNNLLRREIELYYQLPKDMKRIGPILVLFMLPVVPYISLPILYLFPRQLLCSHFWSLQQKADFQILNLRDRLVHNRPVFRHLQTQMDFLKPHHLYEPWKSVIANIGSGQHPSVENIVVCKTLFAQEPYCLLYLSRNHVKHLLKMHGMRSGFFFRRRRLAYRAFILRELDKAIKREGGVNNLPLDALKRACFMRGLNPTNLSNEEMIKWLGDWIKLTDSVDKDSYSLLLHAPILLAYNAPSNWKLIYKDK
ncbi:LETM1 domain-containing protein 1 [Diorhabda carinulata]|uniref:LETM1 domain-containing protein 1 n=1 Tax=Diorhabda carinulata TaxID=1163345 RepID=UPI0025A19F63|nr:LETM1 domain-containing protein 1 [Diorhabda carinulata]